MRKKNYRCTRKVKVLTPQQKQFIEKNWIVLSDYAMANYLETTEGAIRKLRHQMGLNRRHIKDYIKDIPLIVWMPRDSYEEYQADVTELGIDEL